MIFGRDLGRNLEFIRADISSCKVAGNRFRTLLVILELVTRHGDIFFQLIDQISFALVQDGEVSVGIEVFQFYLFVGTDDDFHIGAFARKGNGVAAAFSPIFAPATSVSAKSGVVFPSPSVRSPPNITLPSFSVK